MIDEVEEKVEEAYIQKKEEGMNRFCLGKPTRKKSAVFLNIVQKAFDPLPLLFEHLSYFAGGVF